MIRCCGLASLLCVVLGDIHINSTFTALDAQGLIDEVVQSEQLCALYHFAAVNNASSDPSVLTSLAECYARGYVKGEPLSVTVAASWCDRATRAQPQKARQPGDSIKSSAVSIR